MNRSASNSLTLRSSEKKKKKNQPKRKMRYWILEYDSPVNDEESHESFPDDETACDDRVTLSLERVTHFLRGRFFPLRSINFSLIISLVMEALVVEYDSPVNDEESHESFPDDETACDDRVTLSLERETHFLRGRFFLFRKKYSL